MGAIPPKICRVDFGLCYTTRMEIPTSVEVERMRRAARDTMGGTPDAQRVLLALCDLADAVLAATSVELSAEQRATWGTCKRCKAPHGEICSNVSPLSRGERGHACRHTAAPTHARLVDAGPPTA